MSNINNVINQINLLIFRLLSVSNSNPSAIFTSVFMTFWLGGLIITINIKHLGGHVSTM